MQGVCQLFGIFFYFIYETFGQQNGQQNTSSTGKSTTSSLNCKCHVLDSQTLVSKSNFELINH